MTTNGRRRWKKTVRIRKTEGALSQNVNSKHFSEQLKSKIPRWYAHPRSESDVHGACWSLASRVRRCHTKRPLFLRVTVDGSDPSDAMVQLGRPAAQRIRRWSWEANPGGWWGIILLESWD